MGVQNFWQLIESTGRPVNMNKGLEGKILAIDISIWLHQAAKGMRDRQNPHILLLLHRICKLLHFKIKPIFIFDGGVPELKRRTLTERRQRRDVAAIKAKEAKSKVRTNYLKMLAIQQLRGEEIDALPPLQDEDREKDLFELPDSHLRGQLVDNDNDEEDDDDYDEIIENSELEPVTKPRKQRTVWSRRPPGDHANDRYALPNFKDLDDSALNSLPVEMQHEILSDMKESLKRGKHQVEDMPQKSDDFSDYQVQKLLKQSTVSKKILSLNKAIKRQKFDIPSESNARVYAGKLASDASTQYILIKSDTVQKSTPNNLSRISSTSSPSPSFSRQSTSDFCANNMMNRDPVIGLTPRRNTTIEIDEQPLSPIKADISFEEKPQPPIIVINSPEQNDEEQNQLEIDIQRSLEDQEKSNLSESVESSSEDDEDDFIDVPVVPKQTEPILLPELTSDESHEIVDTSQINTSSEFIELDHDDESSRNSTAIEDIQLFLNDQPMITDAESKETSFSQLESLDQLQAELIDDTAAQLATARGNERLTATLTDTMHEDTQYLLRLFGIPYLVSPTEAEAQCAFLNLSNQCDGVITDDSDVWLFGASHVYRHFFRQNQLVEYYDGGIIANQLGLDRESMIAVGMIVGSDYTKGIPNAGIMTALEILQEFHGTCMERLEKFRRWWRKAQKPDYVTQSKVLKRLKNLELFEGFPNQTVYDAYITPKVDRDHTKFTWAMPQLELLREFIGSKLKWDRRRVDEMVLPVIKRMNTKEVQPRIDSFFAPFSFESSSNQFRKNARLKSAVDLLKQRTQEAKETDNGDHVSESDDGTPIPERESPKKRKRTRTTKLMGDVLGAAGKTKQRRSRKKPAIAPPVLSEDESF